MSTLQLDTGKYQSRVLRDWLRTRPGAESRLAGSINNTQIASSSNYDAMRELFQPIPAASGYSVNDKTAMAVSTVYACLNKLSGSILQLPVRHYRYSDAGDRQRVNDSALWFLLNEQPHPLWTSASWKEWIVRCVGLRGDQHTRIIRSSNISGGRVIGLQPLHPDLVIPRLIKVGQQARLVYDVVDQFNGKVETVDQDDMLHFTSFGFNGVKSLSAIQHVAKNAIGNSLAASDYTGKTIGEGALPQIALEYAGRLSDEQAKLLRDSFVATYTGLGARKLPLVLTEGGKVSEISISPVDMQLIEARSFEKEDICQALGVPPIIVGMNDKASSWGTGIEQIILGFVRFTVKPMLCRWEEELNRKLFRNAGQFIEFELDGLLRGDSKAQSEVFKAALGGPGSGDGYMTINEIRRLKNLTPLAGGDELYKAPRDTNQGANVENQQTNAAA